MNCYGTADQLRARTGAGVEDMPVLCAVLEAASRSVDLYCGRHFYTRTESRELDSKARCWLTVPDLLRVTAFATDDTGDRTFSTAWTADTDYLLGPDGKWPKTNVTTPAAGAKWFPFGYRTVKITGEWGYGDGLGAAPWLDSGVTLTVATAGATTVALSAVTALIAAGSTIRCGTEDMFVTAASGTTLIVRRGVNGTAAAVHAAGAVTVAQYPAEVIAATQMIASSMWNYQGHEGLLSGRIGNYSWQAEAESASRQRLWLLDGLRRIEF